MWPHPAVEQRPGRLAMPAVDGLNSGRPLARNVVRGRFADNAVQLNVDERGEGREEPKEIQR